MKDRNILNNIIEIINEIGMTLFAACILTAFLVCLTAPALKNVLCEPLMLKRMNASSDQEFDNLNTQMTMIKVGLWIIAIIAWTVLIGANLAMHIKTY